MCWNMIEVMIFAINFMKEFSYNPFALLHVLLSSFILLPHIPLKDFVSFILGVIKKPVLSFYSKIIFISCISEEE